MNRCLLPLLISAGLASSGAEPPKQAWSYKAAFSMVALAGNASGQTFGFTNEYRYAWTGSSLALNAGGVRANSTAFAYSASGTGAAPGQYTVVETRTTTTTAESYYANGRYDQAFSARYLWFAGLGWDRNPPAASGTAA